MMVSCRSGVPFATRVRERYEEWAAQNGAHRQIAHLDAVDFQFSDGETCVRLEGDVNGHDVFVFQALYDPTAARSIDENYMAFLATVRALCEWGANRVTGVLPYLAYARQDKPTRFQREPTTAQLMADLGRAAGLQRLVVWQPHSDQLHGFYGRMPVDALSALGLFADEFSAFRGRDDVIAVAPDGGASKFIMHFARMLDISSAVASKYRPQPEEAELSELMGDFSGKRTAVVLDDMISTGGTVEATVRALVDEKGIDDVHLGVVHNLCTARARARLVDLHERYGLRRVVVTDSIPQTEPFQSLPFARVHSLADATVRAVNRIHANRAVDHLGELSAHLTQVDA